MALIVPREPSLNISYFLINIKHIIDGWGNRKFNESINNTTNKKQKKILMYLNVDIYFNEKKSRLTGEVKCVKHGTLNIYK